jgi:hypothetical protein
MPAVSEVKVGNLLLSIITAHNALQAEHDSLTSQYQALLGHLDIGNVTGLGNQHVANYSKTRSPAAATSPVGSL